MTGTVQTSFMPVREIGNGYIALDAPQTLERRTLCGVIEVHGVNYLLKSEEEQRLLNDVFRVTLAGLSYPIQVIMRIQPFNVEHYLSNFTPPADSKASRWTELASAYSTFVEELSKKRTLMQRRFYLVVPAGQSINEDGSASYAQQFFYGLWQSRKQVHEELSQAYQRLNLRCAELMRQLLAMGLSVQRLAKAELIDFEYSMLSSKRARIYPLQESWLAAQPVRHAEPPMRLPFSFREYEKTESHQHPLHKKKRLCKPLAKQKYCLQEDAHLWTELADLLAPAAVNVTPSMLYVDCEWLQVLDVFALPRRVSPGWFNRLAALEVPVDICFYYQPLSTGSTMSMLQRKHFEVSTTNEMNSERGKHQPITHIAQADIEDLMNRIAAGQDRLLEFSMRLMVRGDTKKEVAERAARLRSSLQGMLLACRPLIFEQDRAFRSCLPHCRNELRSSHAPLAMASHEASSTFPFLSQNLLMQKGILEGITIQGHEPIILDWWAKEQRNSNRLIVAPSGSGKSFKAKLDTLRSHLWYGQRHRSDDGQLRYQTFIVDIEREYKRLVTHLDGQWIRIAPGTDHYLNPFDLPQAQTLSSEGESVTEDVLAEKIAQLQSLLEVMLAEHTDTPGYLSNAEKGLLDRVLFSCYERRGITKDPATHYLTPPLLSDLHDVLSAEKEADKTGLAQRLHRFVHGSLAGLFGGHTNVSLETKPVISFDIHDVPKELRPISLFLISGYVWNLSFGSQIPRQFIVDELLTLYQYEEGKNFLESLFQRARKHYLSVVGITQYPKILLDSTIPTNCATNIIMAQELASLAPVSEIFHLSETEIQMVRSFGKGEALLLTNDKRFAVRFDASESEYIYCTSDPADLARLRKPVQEEQQHE
jgi:hypothetical protein